MERAAEWPGSTGAVAKGGGGQAGAGTWTEAVEQPRARQDRAGEYWPWSLQKTHEKLPRGPATPAWPGRASAAAMLAGLGARASCFGMFIVTESDAAAIRAAFHEEGELSAVIELRQRFPGITDHAQARACARTIAGWQPLPAAP